MTNEEINSAIAKHCGVHVEIRNYEPRWRWPDEDAPITGEATDDLNAMHEAEKTLTKRDRAIYSVRLQELLPPDGQSGAYDEHDNYSVIPTVSMFAIINATARQRAEAFFKVISPNTKKL